MTRQQIIIFIIVVILALLVYSSFALQEKLISSLEEISIFIELNPVLGVFIFVIFSILSAILSFFSSIILVPIAIFVWGSTTTFLLLVGSWFIGAIGGYLIAKSLGRKIVSYFVNLKKLEHYEKIVSRDLSFISVLLLRFALPSELVSYILGILRYNFSKFILVILIPEIVFAIVAVYASEFFLEFRIFSFLGIALVGLIIVSVSGYLFRKKFLLKYEEEVDKK